MQALYDPEEKVMCPYDKSHYIRRCKMAFHLVKCKKNYPNQRMLPCDFNTTHLIPEPELKYHHQTCPDRKKIEIQLVGSQSGGQDKFPIPNFEIEYDEVWNDCNQTSYDPKKYVENHGVLRHLDVESDAKRRDFRFNERQRLSNLSSQNIPPVDNRTEIVTLPSHSSVLEAEDDQFKPSRIQQQLRMQTNKVFVQEKNPKK